MPESATLKARYRVEGMDCASCATKIETAVKRVPGVAEASASFTAGTLNVTHDGTISEGAVERAVQGIGYSIVGSQAGTPSSHASPPKTGGRALGGGGADDDDDDSEPAGAPWWTSPKAMLVGATAIAMAVAYLVSLVLPGIGHWAFLAALTIGLVPIARRAVTGALAGTPFSIETLMTIAAVGAVVIGATEEAATVVLLFLVGELLEGVAARRARASIHGLTNVLPKTAHLVDGNEGREVSAESLEVGATILVRPGDRLPADGEIIDGSSLIDESTVTGEGVPKRKGSGDQVFAGTINSEAVLKVRVTAAAADNTIARVVKLVEEAKESKAPTERLIERFARYYTPGVLVAGALVAIVPPVVFGQSWGEWVYKGLAVLLIGCPCALVISTPAAIAAGLSNGARRGLLLKGGAVLEELRRITTVALDKTGTLTRGKPAVTDVEGFDRDPGDVLRIAATVESGSSHPLALAILAKADADGVQPAAARNGYADAGKGVGAEVDGKDVVLASPRAAIERASLDDAQKARIEALNDEGKTVSVVIEGWSPIGLIAMRDEPREDAKTGIDALKAAGIQTVMLTGDNERAAKAIGQGLGIEVRAGLLPQDKQRLVKELQGQGRVVAKVGDGINDAPALAAADIGIAMGGGTDVALETADAAVLHGRVMDIADMVTLSKSVMANITQNITIALALKVVFLVTTIIGITGLWPAILADTGATVLVTANALRLLGTRPKQ